MWAMLVQATISSSCITVMSPVAVSWTKKSPEIISLRLSTPSRIIRRANLRISSGPSQTTAKPSWYM